MDLDEQVWQQTVADVLIDNALERLSIVVTPEEVAQEMVMNPPQGFRQVPDFQRDDGSFDESRYRQFLANVSPRRWYEITRVTWGEYEEGIRRELQIRKLQQAIQAAGRVSEAELRQAYADQNERVRVKVVAAPVALVPEAGQDITGREIQRYYESHPDEYQQDARVRLAYVMIPRRPSPRDTARAEEDIRMIHRQLLAGADFAELANRYSEDETNARLGGELGTFARGQMVSEFDSVAFLTGEGEISDVRAGPRRRYTWR